MDGGPYRGPRPAERRVAAQRPEPAQRQPEEAESVNVTPKATHRTTASHYGMKKEKSSKRFLWPIIALIIVIILSVAGWLVWSKTQNNSVAIDSNKYQAVFFTNGQVYFGKLQPFNNEYLKLTDIFYLQTQAAEQTDPKNPQKTTTDQNGVQLIKLGDEVHGPEDEMVISKDQVLFYENLKTDGKVAQSIEKYKSSN